ncbi:MAG: 2-hydroxyacyl-CoA dehydratase family protein [Oscillospiraceae bacterium]
MDYKKLFETELSGDAVKAWRAQGKKALGVVCCHVPEEILHAAGVMPVRLKASGCTDSSQAEAWMSSFSCSFARSILQYLMDGTYQLDGVVSSDGCAMATRLFDNFKYLNEKEGWGKSFYFLNAPRTSGNLSVDFYRDELNIFIQYLEELSGNKVTEDALRHSVELYNEARRLTMEMYELRKADHPVLTGEEALKVTLAFTELPVEDYIEMMKSYLADLKKREPLTGYRARFVVIGSALDDPEYLKIIENKGGLVVGDVLCFGSRPFEKQCVLDNNDVVGSLAKYYLERIVCPRMVDSRVALHHEVVNVAKEYKADGVIYAKMQNCEVWGAENFLLNADLDEAKIPYLIVQREENLSNAGQLEIRAEAFIEMVEKEG